MVLEAPKIHATAADVERWRQMLAVRRFYVGIDLAQARDRTAVCVIEHTKVPQWPDEGGWVDKEPEYKTQASIRHLERLPKGMDYTEQVGILRDILTREPLKGNSKVGVDASGAGRAVVDMLKKAGLRFVPVIITRGSSDSMKGGIHYVSKSELVSPLIKAIHCNELLLADGLVERDAFMQELAAFTTKQTPGGAIGYEAASGTDDLVIATCIAMFLSYKHASKGIYSAPVHF